MVIDKRQRLGRMTFKIIIKTYETILIRLKDIYIYIFVNHSISLISYSIAINKINRMGYRDMIKRRICI